MKAKQAKEFFEALNYISAEKGLNSSSLIKKLEKAIVLAVKKQYGKVEDINVDIDEKNLNFNVSFKKMVVDVVKNSSNEILLEDALKYNKKAKIGEPIEIKVDATQIGRLAAQAAKQQIMQGIKDIERENVLEKIGDKIGRILTAKVDVIDPVFGNVIFKIDDSDVVLYKNNQLPNDEFAVGDMVKVYAIEVDHTAADSLIKISRTHPDFVKCLFKMQVPEIEEGKIEIKNIARQAGVRTKIAVYSNDENLDAVGCCIGTKGVRIAEIIKELKGEKIDIIKYSEDKKEYISSALFPAKALEVEILEIEGIEKIAYVSVASSQLSLAIGANGVNVKLAAFLTGYKIDISPENTLGIKGFKSTVKEKYQERLKKLSEENKDKIVEKSLEETEEEEDIHSFEVEKMLREDEKKKG